MRRVKRVLYQCPTGGGKTVTASLLYFALVAKANRGWFVVHRKELIDQTALTFRRAGIPYGFIAAGYPENKYQPVQICMIDTLRSRLGNYPAPDVIGYDECHHLGAATWAKVMNYYSKAWHLGFSATPCRLDGKGLHPYFDVIVHGPTVAWLMQRGYLSGYKVFGPVPPNLSGVKSRAGDYVSSEIADAMDRSAIIGDIVSNWRKHSEGKRTIAFAVTIEHSTHMVERFNRAGIRAAHLDADTPKQQRRDITAALAEGDIDIVSNVNLFGEGYDLAAQAGRDVTVEAVILARPTKSLGLHFQQVGRALRPKPEPAIILDHAGNTYRHGLPDDPQDWTLEDKPKQKKKKGEGDEEKAKQCPKCAAWYSPLKRKCPECGFMPPVQSRGIEEVDGQIEELDLKVVRQMRVREQSGARSIDDLVDLGVKRGYKNPAGWAAHIWTARARGGKHSQV